MTQLPDFTVIRSKRGSLSLQITPAGELIVKAPKILPTFIIKQFVYQKSDWIKKTLEKVNKRRPKAKQFIEGEGFLFLGRTYALKLYDGIEVKASGEHLFFPRALVFRAKKEIENWYLAQARAIITRRVEFHAKQMKATYKSIVFSDTKSKWGTCTHDNHLQFSWRLVMAPLMVLDYVVIHELSHTTEKNHGHAFWRRVEQFTPAFRQHRKWLNTHGHSLM